MYMGPERLLKGHPLDCLSLRRKSLLSSCIYCHPLCLCPLHVEVNIFLKDKNSWSDYGGGVKGTWHF